MHCKFGVLCFLCVCVCFLLRTLIFRVILIFSPCAFVPNSTTVLIPFASTFDEDTTGTTGLEIPEPADCEDAEVGDCNGTAPSSFSSTSPQLVEDLLVVAPNRTLMMEGGGGKVEYTPGKGC